tara:strand:- start:378 stop:872 length:495 start_codon:yes stop_codon:yes gene_type:complete
MISQLILGIDPGLAETGYAIIEKLGSKERCLEHGTIKTKANTPIAERLLIIHQALLELYKTYTLDACAIEQLFFNKNACSALLVSQAVGVMTVLAAQQHVPVFFYTPLQVKQALCGHGRAEKEQIKYMLSMILNPKPLPKTSHAADAIAVGICHAAFHKVELVK